MPTISGLRRALERMGAKERNIVWTCMREVSAFLITGAFESELQYLDVGTRRICFCWTSACASTVRSASRECCYNGRHS